jgi:hypothetical protein
VFVGGVRILDLLNVVVFVQTQRRRACMVIFFEDEYIYAFEVLTDEYFMSAATCAGG